MQYPYTEQNILNFPQKYMYPPYKGKKFLQAWEQSRTNCLKQIETPKQTNNSTDFLLFAALLPDKLTIHDMDILEGLLQRFEISKKLPQELIPPRYSLNNKPLLNVLPYACMARVLGYFVQKTQDLRYLNCLLKLNDLLCSLDIPIEAYPFIHHAFEAEKTAVFNLLQKE